MNRHILQRKDPRVQLTQNPDTSEPTISASIKNSKVRKSETMVEIEQTLTIDAYDSVSQA